LSLFTVGIYAACNFKKLALYSFLYIRNKLSSSYSRVLRRMFVPKRDEVTGEWRKLHNEELRGPPL
jgi:hypothetical protein